MSERRWDKIGGANRYEISKAFWAPLMQYKPEWVSGEQYLDFLFGVGFGRDVRTFKTLEAFSLQAKQKQGVRFIDGLPARIIPAGSFIVARWDSMINPGHVEVETWKSHSKTRIYMLTQDVWELYIEPKVEELRGE